jgi:hypothetical protein
MPNIPGLVQPTIPSYPPGANSPATAAKSINDANNQKLQNINQMAAGSRRRKRGGGNVNVPVIKPIYTSQNGPGADPVAQQAQGQSINMQSAANNVYDNQASKMGGSRRKKRGGNPDWLWGCFSGGRRRTCRRKTRKHKKRTKRHRR